jgi:hypothetical protein
MPATFFTARHRCLLSGVEEQGTVGGTADRSTVEEQGTGQLTSRGQVNYRCLILHVRALSNECQCRCHWHKSDRLIHGFRVRRLASSAST